MRLYHHPASSAARRVTMTAALLGIALELVDIDLESAESRRRLHEVNPNTKVPVLDDDGFLLWESGAIMQYLAERVPDQTLYPSDGRARADVNRWIFWACQHFSPAVGVMTFENIWKGMIGHGPADPVELARGERDVLECGTVLDNHLAGRTYLAGESLTLADIAVATPMMYMELAQLPLHRFPNIIAWFRRIEALPVWQSTQWNRDMPKAA